MRFLITLVLIILLLDSVHSQNANPYAVWEDQSSNDYWFVQLNATTGIKTNIQVIPGMSAFVGGNKTFVDTDSGYYHVTGLIGATPHLFTIDIANGNTIYSPVMSANVVGLEYNCNDSSIYGLRVTGNNYDLVRVSRITGQTTQISPPVLINGYVGGSFSFDRVQNLYNFVALTSLGYFLHSYRIPTGVLVYNNPIAGSLAGHRYSCTDSSVYALQESGTQYLMIKIKLDNGFTTTMGALSNVTPGIVAESSAISATGEYVYRGFNGSNAISIITVNPGTGSTISAVPTNENATGFEFGVCCYDTSSVTVSLHEIHGNNKVMLSPNPVNEILFVKSDVTIDGYKLSTIQGVVKLQHNGIASKEFILNINEYSAAIYILEIFFNDGTQSKQKVIKF